MVKTVTLTVSDAFEDAGTWTSDPEVATQVLLIARNVLDMITTRVSAASGDVSDATRDAIREALAMQKSAHTTQLQETLKERDDDVRRLEVVTNEMRRDHEVERCRWQYETETRVRDATAEERRALETAQREIADVRRVHEQLTSTMNEQVERARSEAERRVADEYAERLATMQTSLETRTLENMELERRVCAKATEAGEVQERHAEVVATLKERIGELETPMGRGRAGELDVTQTLRDVGLHVEDTSMGEKKDLGYLDLLVRPEGSDDSNMRVAIEMKNVREVQKRDRDDFERKVASGVARNLFDAAIFISIRAHTKMGNPVVLQMFPDDGNRPLVPVTWLGTERAKNVTPITQEQVETHVFMMLALLSQCHNIRRELCNGLRDEHVEGLQGFVDEANVGFQDTFADLARQNKMLDDMRASLNVVRARCIGMYTSLWSLNRSVPWLGRSGVHTAWMDYYQTARQKLDMGMREAEVWNQCSKGKNVIERSVGREAMFLAYQNDQKKKRSRGDKEEEDGSA